MSAQLLTSKEAQPLRDAAIAGAQAARRAAEGRRGPQPREAPRRATTCAPRRRPAPRRAWRTRCARWSRDGPRRRSLS
jgi:hypothetical protein